MMIKLLDKIGLTRDSALLWLGILGGVASAALGQFDLIKTAIPIAGPKTNAWLQLVGLMVATVSGYLRASPLAQSGSLGRAADPERTLTASGKLPMVFLALALLGTSACASTNVRAEKLTRAAIQASEDNRCTKHPAPCLSDGQFKGVNVQLYRVSLAGETYTRLARAGTAKPLDALTFANAVTSALSAVAVLDTTGTVSGILAKLNGVLNAAGVK